MGTRISFLNLQIIWEACFKGQCHDKPPYFSHDAFPYNLFLYLSFCSLTNLLFISRKMFSNKPFFISKLYTAHSQICLSREPLEKGSRFFLKKKIQILHLLKEFTKKDPAVCWSTVNSSETTFVYISYKYMVSMLSDPSFRAFDS